MINNIKSAFENAFHNNEIPAGGCILYEGQKKLAEFYIGDLKNGQKFNPDTKARIASISKLSTAICLLHFAQMGKIDLDSDCSPYLGFKLRHPNFPQSPISARMILSHTSGIRDGENYKGVIGETLESFFVPDGENYENNIHWAQIPTPLGGFCYSNLGMGLIAQMVENLSNMRFDLAAKAIIFDKLKIDCGFNWSNVPLDNFTALYRRQNEENIWKSQVDDDILTRIKPTHFAKNNLKLEDYKIGTNGLLMSPQGGLRASLNDLHKIAQCLMGYHDILNEKTIENMRQIVWSNSISPVAKGGEDGSFQAFGTGIHHIIANQEAPIKNLKVNLLGHYGQAYGLLGGLWFDPISNKGFNWFINGSLVSPKLAPKSGLFEIEENIMNAAAIDLGLIK